MFQGARVPERSDNLPDALQARSLSQQEDNIRLAAFRQRDTNLQDGGRVSFRTTDIVQMNRLQPGGIGAGSVPAQENVTVS